MADTLFEARIRVQIAADNAQADRHGWPRTPRHEGGHTIGDFIGAVFSVDNPADARTFYAGYLAWLRTQPLEHGYTVEQVARSNIGWCFGEGMDGDRIAMWHAVTGATHPWFGTMTPSPSEAFAVGLRAANERHGS